MSSNGKLTVSADKTASPGTTVSVPISIQYSKGTVSAGVTVRVTASNRPLARINAKTVKVKAGSSEEVNLLSDAYNPFPDSALTVTGCTSDGASKLTVDCPSNGVVSINAASDIGASTNKVIVNVRDATNTKEREVTGTINVSVMDKPDAPLLSPIAGDPQDGAVNLSWTAGSSNAVRSANTRCRGERRFRREIVRIRDLLPNHRLEERQDVLVQGAGQE